MFIPAAGVPWFVTLFGRDTLDRLDAGDLGLSGVRRRRAAAARRAPGDRRRPRAGHGARQDPARDPPRRAGPARDPAVQPYYGTHDATSLFIIVLSYLYHWLGDEAILRRYLTNAEAAMRWIDRYGDRDRDGFQEYKTRSSHGYYNQGWKDAGDAIPHADGTLAPLPIAPCELQGYVYDAKLRMADIYELLGRPKDAARLRREARALYDRVNDAFWWEDEGTYYLGLDGAKQPIRSVASNAGPPAPVGDRAARARRPGRRAAAGRGHVVGLGHPDAVVGSRRRTTRSATTPAASGRTTTR